MVDKNQHPDADLIEDLDEEEFEKLVLEAQQKARSQKEEPPKKRTKLERIKFWTIAIVFIFSGFSFFVQTYSIPAIDFLITSAKLSNDENIQLYKESVVSIVTNNSKGTGFSISDDGYIITNHHVIEDKTSIIINFPEYGVFPAEVIAEFPEIDTAFLKVDAEHLPFLQLDQTDDKHLGEDVRFIGNPLKFQWIVNEGIVIEQTNIRSISRPVTMLQAPVYRGNSGSPIFSSTGEVIGVIFATTKHEQYGKVGLFIPIADIIEVMDTELKKQIFNDENDR